MALTSHRANEAGRLARWLVGTVGGRGGGRHAVTGEVATLEALRTAGLQTLLVAERPVGDPGAGRDPAIEVARIAYLRRVPVVTSGVDALRRIGGVAGLLRERPEAARMPADTPRPHLDLVA